MWTHCGDEGGQANFALYFVVEAQDFHGECEGNGDVDWWDAIDDLNFENLGMFSKRADCNPPITQRHHPRHSHPSLCMQSHIIT